MKIVVCALAINDWYREVVKYGLKNLQDYCNLHNYKCIINTENDTDIYDGKRECAWYKIKAIKKVLMTEECDYIVWIDADIQILRQAQNLEYFIKKYLEDTGKDLALIQENPLNTGVMFIRNCDFNLKLMDELWNNDDQLDGQFWDQSSLCDLYARDENIRAHIYVIPYLVQDELVVFWANYYPGKHFMLHSARCNFDRISLMYQMDTYYMFKMDEETDEEYKERLLYVTTDLIRKDIDCWLRKEYAPRKYSARCQRYLRGEDPFFHKK